MRRLGVVGLVGWVLAACHGTVVQHGPGRGDDGDAPGDGGDSAVLLPPDCARDHGGCDLLTTCTMVSGAPVCGPCPEPFVGDGATGCRCDAGAPLPGFEAREQPVMANIAAGRPYTLSPAPNYTLCTDAGDATQLTDGVYTAGYFWTQASTVGWVNQLPLITIDLGSVRAIRGLSYNTAAGVAGVEWPLRVLVLVADEDGLFHFVAELVELHQRHAILPAPGTHQIHRLWTDELVTHGRYLALAVVSSVFTFADEVEVFEGESAWLSTPLPGTGSADPRAAATQAAVATSIRQRIVADMRAVVAEAESLPAELQDLLACELGSVAAAAARLPEPADDFRAVLPLNGLHARVMSLRARVWQAEGIDGLVAWPDSTWDRRAWMADPPSSPTAGLQVELMRGEHRAAAVSIANATLRPRAVTLRLLGLPGGDDPAWISVRPVLWTDTWELTPVAAALGTAAPAAAGSSIDIPAGTTRQVWLDLHPVDVPAGTHTGVITVDDGASIPLTVVVHPLDFPVAPRLHVGGWDYVNGTGNRGVTGENRAALVSLLREVYVDTPWATTSVWPAGSYDGAGQLTTAPSTAAFDDWLSHWPGARQYRIFAAVSPSFAGFATGTAQFHTAVGAWAQFWEAALVGRSLDPTTVGLLLVDEPHEPTQDATIRAWADALHDAGVALRVWEDPTWDDPAAADAAMIAACDVLCPNRQMFVEGDESFRSFFRAQRVAGKSLEFYSCSGPARLLDPYAYYRLQAWTAWVEGAAAISWWAFADTGGASSWNEYALVRRAFTPLFLDDTSATTGKHLEAIREGVEDFETLALLEAAVVDARGRGVDAALISEAEALLASAPQEVLAAAGTAILWDAPLDRSLADGARSLMLEMLDRLAP